MMDLRAVQGVKSLWNEKTKEGFSSKEQVYREEKYEFAQIW